MNGETDVDTGLMTKEEEQMTEEENSPEKNSLLREQSSVMVTDEEVVRVATPDKEMGKGGSGLSELGSSPLGSFNHYQIAKVVRMIKYHMYLHWER